MQAISPVVPGYEEHEVVYGKNQPQYMQLPTLAFSDEVGVGLITRWRLTWRERWRLLFRGDLFVHIRTFGNALQPILPTTDAPEIDPTPSPAKVEILQPNAADIRRFSKKPAIPAFPANELRRGR
jgi:hypothetical protein